LLIAGTASNGCCEVSARDAVMLNYKVVMISDASATYTDDMHSNCLQFFYLVYGDVLTVDEAIAGLAQLEQLRGDFYDFASTEASHIKGLGCAAA
jgi:nicotinamidase-related amidase